MAQTSPNSFEQRLARIDQKAGIGATAYQKQNLVQPTRKKRRIHLDVLIFGGLVGGAVGTLFAMQVGVALLASIDALTLYQMVLADYVMGGLILGVVIAPLGFVLSQIFARSNPRGWQFWIGYLAGVLGTNAGALQSQYHILMSASG